jgi:quercetin dioxygenase-like cupin family protein
MKSELATSGPAIRESGNVERVEMHPGMWRQTLVSGKGLMLCLFTLKAGTKLPAHSHVHEQAGFVISGAVALTVNGSTEVTRKGCAYFVASGLEHSALALEDSAVVDAFSPPRAEYID